MVGTPLRRSQGDSWGHRWATLPPPSRASALPRASVLPRAAAAAVVAAPAAPATAAAPAAPLAAAAAAAVVVAAPTALAPTAALAAPPAAVAAAAAPETPAAATALADAEGRSSSQSPDRSASSHRALEPLAAPRRERASTPLSLPDGPQDLRSSDILLLGSRPPRQHGPESAAPFQRS
ncbi:testis-specific gene A8 protein-like [Sorghum bicolor]|uniref:testis-specific gene A8 protein-like n=1 Tax=Sorghum bicolor TaxID=4558 RepID=UPI000B425983|nr:testis-specific gene A8 protein-like [Sorghum bicolor]|eukprot:XP_021321341.1 testis-specific gene A8 protein-like [Sorghum bicolor]